MNVLHSIYEKTVLANERNIKFWEDYLQKLNNLDLNFFNEKLTVPMLVPIGSKMLFRGELRHTNEVTVALGADYFAKCSTKQAEVLRQHRIKDAQEKLNSFIKEREYLTNKMTFNQQNVFNTNGEEIIEVYSEEEEKQWREKHKENVRKYKQEHKQAKEEFTEDVNDEELWDRLEELELQEEMEHELENMSPKQKIEPFIVKEENIITPKEQKTDYIERKEKIIPTKEIKETLNQNSKLDLLQHVLERQDELENKLVEMKHRERVPSKTENDLLERLNEMEEIDELEDEIDRIDDIIETEGAEIIEPEDNSNKQIKRCVSFADEDDSETLELTFTHSNTEPDNTPYRPENGIVKPSDIYDVYSNLFGSETTSILKKTNYTDVKKIKAQRKSVVKFEEDKPDDPVVNKTIVVKDVVEKAQHNISKVENGARPTSLFKKKRRQNRP